MHFCNIIYLLKNQDDILFLTGCIHACLFQEAVDRSFEQITCQEICPKLFDLSEGIPIPTPSTELKKLVLVRLPEDKKSTNKVLVAVSLDL